MFQRATRSL